MNYELIKNSYKWGFFNSANDVKIYVEINTITPEQFKEITGEDYENNKDQEQNNGATSQNG